MMARSLVAEFAKLKRSRVIWWTAGTIVLYSLLTFAVAPVLSGDDSARGLSDAGGVWKKALDAGMYEDTWKAGLLQAPWLIAGGLALLLFAFIAAYVFGREFKERTAVQAFTTPVPRAYAVSSKMAVLGAWVFGWSLLLFVVHCIDLAILDGFATFKWGLVSSTLGDVLVATLMLYLTLPVFAWLAVWGKGYLRPMLAAIVIMGMGNGLASTKISPYFPWNVPLHKFGASWMPIPPSPFKPGAWVVLVVLFVVGMVGMIAYIDRADIAG